MNPLRRRQLVDILWPRCALWACLVLCCPAVLTARTSAKPSPAPLAELASPFALQPALSTAAADGLAVGLLRDGARRWSLHAAADGSLRRMALEPSPTAQESSWDLELRDVALRPLLYQLAELRGLNLLLAPELDGRVTLRLVRVSWQQAWQLLLEQHSLSASRDGRLLRVWRRAAARAAMEVSALPLHFAAAADVAELLRMAVEGAHVAVDMRINTLFLSGDAAQRHRLRELVALADVPVRQVSIEARIVMVRADAVNQLGVRWRLAAADRLGSASVALGADDDSTQALLRSHRNSGALADATGLAVDFGGGQAGFSIGVTGNSAWLSLALAALESKGLGEVIARPRIVTSDRHTATVRSGTQIPFQESAENGGTTVRFKDAVLALEVTPAITADDHILLELVVNQDAPGSVVDSGSAVLPSIDTTELRTRVLARNGETVVLGGILREELLRSELRVPLLGSLPLLGRLFRRQTSSSLKTETLVFITPHILPGE